MYHVLLVTGKQSFVQPISQEDLDMRNIDRALLLFTFSILIFLFIKDIINVRDATLLSIASYYLIEREKKDHSYLVKYFVFFLLILVCIFGDQYIMP